MSAVVERSDARFVQPPDEHAEGGDRFVGTALLLLAGIMVAIQVAAAHIIPPVAVFAVVYAGLGFSVRRWPKRWLLVLALVFTSLHLVTSIPFFLENLAHPESPVGFLAESFALLTGIAAIAGAIAGLRGARPGSRRPIAVAAGGLAAAAVVVALVAAAGVDGDSRQPGDVPVTAASSQYPEQVQVPAGEAVLWVENTDLFHHTLVVEGTDVRAVLPASTAVRVPVDLAPGTYRYLCDVPGHDAMTGEIVAS
jgi:plastocyanin